MNFSIEFKWSRIDDTEIKLKKLKIDYESKIEAKKIEESREKNELVARGNAMLEEKWRSENERIEKIRLHEQDLTFEIQQEEINVDDQIEDLKLFHEENLRKWQNIADELKSKVKGEDRESSTKICLLMKTNVLV